jgi:hypothetical protein
MLQYLTFGLVLIALTWIWRTTRQNKELQEKISQVNSRVYNLRREMQDAQNKFERDLLKLKFELLKAQGNLQITADMKIGQIYALHPMAQQVLAGFHLGGCSSCGVDERQSLTEAVTVNGRDLEPVLLALNGLLAQSANGHDLSPEQLKTPNVQLQF